MRRLLSVFVWIIIVFAVLFFARDFILKAVIETGAKFATGFSVKIGKLQTDFAKTAVGIYDFKLMNPKSFPDPVMLDLPEVFVDYNLTNIVKGKIHLEAVRVHLRDLILVRNEKGELNLDSLKTAQKPQPSKTETPTQEKPKPAGKTPPIQIDLLELKLDQATYKDYTRKPEPMVKVFKIGVNERMENITGVGRLINIILLRVMTRTPLAAMSNFDLGALQGGLVGISASATELVSVTAGQGLDMLKSATGGTQGITETAPDSLKQLGENVQTESAKVTEGLKGSFSGLTKKIKSVTQTE